MNQEELPQPEHQLEIHLEELLSLLDSVAWEDNYEFSYSGIDYNLITVSKKAIDEGKGGLPAEYIASTAVKGGWDIYLHETIPQEDRRRVLFHEILEVSLRVQGFEGGKAHQITLEEEEKIFGKREK